MLANDASTLDEDTVADYIKALKKLFVIEDLSAWNPNIRSKSAIRTSDTRHFVDLNKMNAPSFLAVITAVGQYAYQRKDGVFVLPIGCLKD